MYEIVCVCRNVPVLCRVALIGPQIHLFQNPTIHISRCLEQASLFVEDNVIRKYFEHRRGWKMGKLLELAEMYLFDLYKYTIMLVYFHVAYFIGQDSVKEEEFLQAIDH
jgi:hypothetical protein